MKLYDNNYVLVLKNMTLNPYPTWSKKKKNYFKWILDLNLRTKSVEFLEEKNGKSLQP